MEISPTFDNFPQKDMKHVQVSVDILQFSVEIWYSYRQFKPKLCNLINWFQTILNKLTFRKTQEISTAI